MSRAWDLYCRTCDEGCGFHVNHRPEKLAELWKYREAFAKLNHIDANIAEFEIKPLGDEYGGGNHLPYFAAVHKDHDVAPRDEYGGFEP